MLFTYSESLLKECNQPISEKLTLFFIHVLVLLIVGGELYKEIGSCFDFVLHCFVTDDLQQINSSKRQKLTWPIFSLYSVSTSRTAKRKHETKSWANFSERVSTTQFLCACTWGNFSVRSDHWTSNAQRKRNLEKKGTTRKVNEREFLCSPGRDSKRYIKLALSSRDGVDSKTLSGQEHPTILYVYDQFILNEVFWNFLEIIAWRIRTQSLI